MKTGILTFSEALNPGAVLQAFSLYSALEENGHDVRLIDYFCPAIHAMHRPKPVFRAGMALKTRLYDLCYNTVFFPRRVRYRRFLKRMRHAGPYTKDTVVNADGVFDLYITGSDQVFNLKLTGQDTTYYLDFVTKGKKASFAAGTGNWLPEETAKAGALLQSFDYISVREKSGRARLEQGCGIQSRVIPDPVFLHTHEEWKQLLDLKKKRQGGYVLVYSLYETRALYEIARQAAGTYGIKTVVVTRALRPRCGEARIVRNAGPREFLELFENASYVVTNSFHGTAFSIIFEKPFTTQVSAAVYPERIEELLEQTGLSDRMFRTDRPERLHLEKIDWEAPREAAAALRARGMDYLQEITRR